MGDDRRFAVLTRWVEYQLPATKYPRVADIAGGQGFLAEQLHRVGYNVTLFDQKANQLTRLPAHIVRGDIEKLHFTPGEYTAVIGLHPDICTWHVIRLAAEARAPFIVVPCCIIPPTHLEEAFHKSHTDWIPWLLNEAKNFGFTTHQHLLHFDGQNTAIKGWLS